MEKIFNLGLPSIRKDKELKALILAHPTLDPGYINTSTSFMLTPQKRLIEQMWSEFQPYADPKFQQKIIINGEFLSRAWEMTLGTTLLRLGYKLEARGSSLGPDIKITSTASPTIWVEAVSCSPGKGLDAVPVMLYGVAQNLPMQEMVLRFGNAMVSKFRKYEAYLTSGVVSHNEPYIIAISKGSISYPDSYPSVALRYLYGIGDIALRMPLNPETGERTVTETFFTRQRSIPKKQGKEVQVGFFEDPMNTGVSAVIYTQNNILNHPEPLGSDFIILRNPNAKNPIKEDFFPLGAEWVPKDGFIKYVEKKFIQQANAFAYLK